MTKFLVLGGSGFIGRHVARRLAQRGHEVTSISHDVQFDFGGDVNTIICDLARVNPSEFDELIAYADVIFHFAWTSLPASANSSPIDDLYTNGKITLELLEALKRRGQGRLVFASSGGTVYGRLRTVPVREDHPLDPITAYGVSKLACEKYVQLYHFLYNIDARIIRIANPYGAGQNPSRQQGVVSTFVFNALNDAPVEIWGDGNAVRDFVYIADLVDCLIKVAEVPGTCRSLVPIYNVGGGERHTVNDVVELLEALLGRKMLIVRRSKRAFDVPVSVLNIEKARKELFWTPKVQLKDGIGRMIADLKEDASRMFAS